jgi:hypothetical protein
MRFVWVVPIAMLACHSAPSAPDAQGGTGATCGGLANLTCDATHYCDFRNNGCGGDDSTGTCMPRPDLCPSGLQVCGCDRVIYLGECLAASAGTDVADDGFCTPPQNDFACGHVFCDPATQYCEETLDDTGGANNYVCIDLPAACNGTGSCACLAGETCGTQCSATGTGFTLTCPGG